MNMQQQSPNHRHQNLVVTKEAEGVAGAVSYWRLSGTISLVKLAEKWTEQGLAVDQLPTPTSEIVACGRAVADQQTHRNAQGKRRFVTTLARQGAWAIVEETVIPAPRDKDGKVIGEDSPPTYRRLVQVAFRENKIPAVTAVEATDSEHGLIERTLETSVQHHLGAIDSNDISSWLVRHARKLGAVALRDSGGIYFVPRTNVEIWRKIATAVEAASSHLVFRIPAMRNDEAVAAILDAVITEARDAAQGIEAELQGGNLGKRALATRTATCEAVLAKVAAYEELLGVSMDTIKTRVEVLRSDITAAALVTSDEEVQ
jgi:hypothetical protein